jgi:hypothetical protein
MKMEQIRELMLAKMDSFQEKMEAKMDDRQEEIKIQVGSLLDRCQPGRDEEHVGHQSRKDGHKSRRTEVCSSA